MRKKACIGGFLLFVTILILITPLTQVSVVSVQEETETLHARAVPYADITTIETVEQVVNFTGGSIDWSTVDLLRNYDATTHDYLNVTLESPIDAGVIAYTTWNDTGGAGAAYQMWSNMTPFKWHHYSSFNFSIEKVDGYVNCTYNTTAFLTVSLASQYNTTTIIFIFDDKNYTTSQGLTNTSTRVVFLLSEYCQLNTTRWEGNLQKTWVDYFYPQAGINETTFENITRIAVGGNATWIAGAVLDGAHLHYRFNYEIIQPYMRTANWTPPALNQSIYTVPTGWNLTHVKATAPHLEVLLNGVHLNHNFNNTKNVLMQQWSVKPNTSTIEISAKPSGYDDPASPYYRAWWMEHRAGAHPSYCWDFTFPHVLGDVPSWVLDKFTIQVDVMFPNLSLFEEAHLMFFVDVSINDSPPVEFILCLTLRDQKEWFPDEWTRGYALSTWLAIYDFKDVSKGFRDGEFAHVVLDVGEWLAFRRNVTPQHEIEVVKIFSFGMLETPCDEMWNKHGDPTDPSYEYYVPFNWYVKHPEVSTTLPTRVPLTETFFVPPPIMANYITDSSILTSAGKHPFLLTPVGGEVAFDVALPGGADLHMERGELSFYNTTKGAYEETVTYKYFETDLIEPTAIRQTFTHASCPLTLELTVTKRMTFNPLNAYAPEFSIEAPPMGQFALDRIVVRNVEFRPDYLIVTEDGVTHLGHDFTYNAATETLTIHRGSFIAGELSAAGSVRSITIQLFEDKNALRVRVVDQGDKPVEDVYVVVEHETLAHLGLKWADLTDVEGRVEFPALPNGRFVVKVIKASVETIRRVSVFGVKTIVIRIAITQLPFGLYTVALVVGVGVAAFVAGYFVVRSRTAALKEARRKVIRKRRKGWKEE